jgi:hypothetical protein
MYRFVLLVIPLTFFQTIVLSLATILYHGLMTVFWFDSLIFLEYGEKALNIVYSPVGLKYHFEKMSAITNGFIPSTLIKSI